MDFYKYHALGNDYLVVQQVDVDRELNERTIERICHRHFGIGSDGLLLHDGKNKKGEFLLRIFNPDGSEAEKSGNGLRIYSRFLFDQKLVDSTPFIVNTKGGLVTSEVRADGKEVTVDMGGVSFESAKIPVAGDSREVLNEAITVDGREFRYSAATVGNPHCVLLVDKALASDAKRYGPHLEVEPRFPNRTNVQFMEIIDRNNIRIEIWERGAGYTLASGSSSSASAAIAHRLGLCDREITVHMPGGQIAITIDPDFQIRMRGAVTSVGSGALTAEMFDWP